MRTACWVAALGIASLTSSLAQIGGVFSGALELPPIEYPTHPLNDAVSALNRGIRERKIQLKFDRVNGYLQAALDALDVRVESQIMVFSKTSLQKTLINPRNPRSIFFNDSTVVAWVRGEAFVEVATQDPQQGVIFYTLNQDEAELPQFVRRDDCLNCHVSYSSLGVPGMLVRSVYPDASGQPIRHLGDHDSDHRSPLEERFGGWYVTGKTGAIRHMGNAIVTNPDQPESMVTPQTLNLESLTGKFDPYGYIAPQSDLAALMVFDHQMHMINLLTRVGWEFRHASHVRPAANSILADGVKELVDYLLFIDEAPLRGKLQGSSDFANKFAAKQPKDRRGRSLRQLDLENRLMRYPCSYMLYSDAFDQLSGQARDAIYLRMWQILSGKERSNRYARLSPKDRQSIVEILRETKKGLPGYFQPVVQ